MVLIFHQFREDESSTLIGSFGMTTNVNKNKLGKLQTQKQMK